MNALLFLSFLFACDLDLFGSGSVPVKPKNNKKEVKKPEDKKAKVALKDEYRPYEASGKRDPFRSFLSITQVEEEDENMKKDPKTRYEVKNYLLTGIIWNVEQPRALVEDPTGEGHVVEIGEYLGKNWGKVREITDNTVIIVEDVRTTDGEKHPKPIVLTLRQDGMTP